jgi:hypothetical protein
MRDDLLDAEAAVEWAVTQIPLMQDGFIRWQRSNPYNVVQERDPDTGRDIAVTYDQPFPPIFNAWAGAIINSLRSSLDLLAAALATRNGGKPSHETHFPIFASDHEMIDPVDGIEGKKWLSKPERAAIKALKPYKGGDHTLWPLHRLDILRKHERLLSTSPDVKGFLMIGRHMHVGGTKAIKRLQNKTVLLNLSPGEILNATQGNTLLATFITFREPTLGLADEEVATVLRKFAGRVSEIVKLFTPDKRSPEKNYR